MPDYFLFTIHTANNQKSTFPSSSPTLEDITFHVYWLISSAIDYWCSSTVNCTLKSFVPFFYLLAFLLTYFTYQSEDIDLYVVPSLFFVFWFCLSFAIYSFFSSFLSTLYRSLTPKVMLSKFSPNNFYFLREITSLIHLVFTFLHSVSFFFFQWTVAPAPFNKTHIEAFPINRSPLFHVWSNSTWACLTFFAPLLYPLVFLADSILF